MRGRRKRERERERRERVVEMSCHASILALAPAVFPADMLPREREINRKRKRERGGVERK